MYYNFQRCESSNNTSNLEIERENRLLSIITLHSKGFTQSAIAEKLQLNQLTISRDLKVIKKVRNNIEKYVKDEIPFEYRCSDR